MKRGGDRVSLMAGLAIAALGVALTLRASGDLDMSPGVIGAVVCACVGLIFLLSGLDDEDGGDA